MNNETKLFPRRSFVAGAATLGALAIANPVVALATPTSAEKEAEADAAAAQAEGFAAASAEKQAEVATALTALENMQVALDEASARYTQCILDEEAARARVEECQQRIEDKTAEMHDYQETLSSRARNIYRQGNESFLDVLVGANSFEEFASNWSLLNSITDQDASLVAATRAAKQDLEDAHKELEEQEAIAQQKVEEAEEVAKEAEKTVAEMQAVYDSLSAEAAELMEQERIARAAEQAARAEAAELFAQEEAARRAAEEAARRAAEEAARRAAEAAAASGGGASASGSDGIDPTGESGGSAIYEGGSDIVSRAYACLGAPYVWGAVGPYGYDCSGLVSYCYLGTHARMGTTYTFMTYPQVSDPQPGDICTHSTHCGIYIGDGQMIHASTYGVGVIIGPVQSGMIIVRP
ncbi:MAG: C40 family peptidase [Eggerthellaceae bacterium]|nr:C40 family peptidase [Eggerthellaceae bacterium]